MEYEELARKLAEGTVESRGQFTLSPEAAAKQYGPLIAQEPNIFLGRLLQAANASEAEAMHVQVHSTRIRVKLLLNDSKPFVDMLDYFQGGRRPEGTVQTYLNLAFTSALARTPKALSWYLTGPLGGFFVDLLSGLPPKPLRPEKFAEATLELEFSEPISFLSTLTKFFGFSKFWLGLRADIHNFLHQRCCFSAVPVKLDDVHIQFTPDRGYFGRLEPSSRTNWKNQFPLRAAQLDLQPKRSLKSAIFNAPSPASLRPIRTLIDQGVYGTTDNKVLEAMNRLKLDLGTRLLKLNIPGDFSVNEKEVEGVGLWDVEQYLAGRYELLKLHDREIVELTQQWILKAAPYSLPEVTAFGRPSQLACSRLLALRKGSSSRHFVPVKDGFALSCESPESWPTGSFAVCAVPDLKMDALGMRIVQDGTYENLLTALGDDLQKLSDIERRQDLLEFHKRL